MGLKLTLYFVSYVCAKKYELLYFYLKSGEKVLMLDLISTKMLHFRTAANFQLLTFSSLDPDSEWTLSFSSNSHKRWWHQKKVVDNWHFENCEFTKFRISWPVIRTLDAISMHILPEKSTFFLYKTYLNCFCLTSFNDTRNSGTKLVLKIVRDRQKICPWISDHVSKYRNPYMM